MNRPRLSKVASVDTRQIPMPTKVRGPSKHYIPEPNTFIVDLLGLEATELERYKLFTQYLEYSATFTKLDWFLGTQASIINKTPDQQLVYEMILSFKSASRKDWKTWWEEYGKTKLVKIKSQHFKSNQFDLEAIGENFKSDWHCVVFASTLTATEALREIKKYQANFKPKVKAKQLFYGKYRLMKSGMRNDYLRKGIEALELYKQGFTNWQIGNIMKLVPSCCFDANSLEAQKRGAYKYEKNALGAAARRLITDAARVAENAARGRFPTGAKFPEEDLSPYLRRKVSKKLTLKTVN